MNSKITSRFCRAECNDVRSVFTGRSMDGDDKGKQSSGESTVLGR